jgi:hypothetical protein
MTGAPTRYTAPGSTCWSVSAKLALLTDIANGKLTVATAHAIYEVTLAELDSWADALAKHGKAGLKAMHQVRPTVAGTSGRTRKMVAA